MPRINRSNRDEGSHKEKHRGSSNEPHHVELFCFGRAVLVMESPSDANVVDVASALGDVATCGERGTGDRERDRPGEEGGATGGCG